MTDNDQSGRVWVFDESSLNQALQTYEKEALRAFPHQSNRIRTTVAAIRDFLCSEHARKLLLQVSRGPK
jgi:hypothetical protein